MTIYLKFDTQEQAVAALAAAGFIMSECNDHFQGEGWGTLFQIPGQLGWFANVYDSETAALDAYRVPEPATPYNVRAQ